MGLLLPILLLLSLFPGYPFAQKDREKEEDKYAAKSDCTIWRCVYIYTYTEKMEAKKFTWQWHKVDISAVKARGWLVRGGERGWTSSASTNIGFTFYLACFCHVLE